MNEQEKTEQEIKKTKSQLKVVHRLMDKQEKTEITKLMLIKAKLTAKWALVKVFLIKFFDIKQFAYAIFTYEVLCKHKSPKRLEYIVLAKVSRNRTADEIKNKLFTLKPPAEDCSLKVVEVKVKPIGEIKSV